ncbi:hypothetical protein [Psychrobacter aestuarii]|uniref:Transposase n=1 Tax=Psychrobacter aestuarii TaxID=556327 RepID=A0ABN0VR12_9GAMM|nr:hypothetical protein [Psychrobacter aestuarii]
MMPYRPIDAVFVHPEQRCYIIYDRGALWQLPRMKIDSSAWLRRKPYKGNTKSLYLSRSQRIHDPQLVRRLRTLNLPTAVRGITLSRFELWWETHGFEWSKQTVLAGASPLAVHEDRDSDVLTKSNPDRPQSMATSQNTTAADTSDNAIDIFEDMLEELKKDLFH